MNLCGINIRSCKGYIPAADLALAAGLLDAKHMVEFVGRDRTILVRPDTPGFETLFEVHWAPRLRLVTYDDARAIVKEWTRRGYFTEDETQDFLSPLASLHRQLAQTHARLADIYAAAH